MFIYCLSLFNNAISSQGHIKKKERKPNNFPCLHLQSSGVHAFLGHRLPHPVHSHDAFGPSPSLGGHPNNSGGPGKALVKQEIEPERACLGTAVPSWSIQLYRVLWLLMCCCFLQEPEVGGAPVSTTPEHAVGLQAIPPQQADEQEMNLVIILSTQGRFSQCFWSTELFI